jgi:hypothetical protein
MAAMAAHARLTGVQGGGNPYSGLQSYASELSLQASYVHRNMPGSAFDYRTQARSLNADRRIAEIDSNVSTYTRDPNAHWKAFGLDLRCPEGRGLHCVDAFGRQLICALNSLHPRAALTFADREIARAA